MDIEISRLTLNELKDRLRERRLPLHGNKADLIQRLEEELNPLLKEIRIAEERRQEEEEAKRKAAEEEEYLASFSHYQDSNQAYTLKRARYSKWIWLCSLCTVITILAGYMLSNGIWEVWFLISLSLASFATSFGTATTTHQWANSTVESSPYRLAAYQALIIWLNRIVIGFSVIYVIYNFQPDLIEKIDEEWLEKFVESLRYMMFVALVVEILLDGFAAKYVAERSEQIDSWFIWTFFIIELVVIIISGTPVVPKWIIFAVGTMFAIGHLLGGTNLSADNEEFSDLDSFMDDFLGGGLDGPP
jgi:hypothetical protein